MRPGRIVVAGLGAAGLAVCQELRAMGWSGRLTVLAEETGLPYDRPPLAKGYLTGKAGADDIGLVRAEALAALDLDLHAGVRASDLDPDARLVTDSAGNAHRYDALVICTGVRPRTLGFGGRGVHVLRTLDDAKRLRADLLVGGRLVVVGGGFLGFEVAASARALGLDVTVVEPLVEPMRDRLGRELATRLMALHREHGVRVLTGAAVGSVVAASDLCGPLVRLEDGTRLPADVVLVAAGATPDTEWLRGTDVPVADGVVCDKHCRARPGVWAAGDVARWHHMTLGQRVRVEHRMNATEQGRASARSVLGEERPFVPVPFVWTDQYDVRIQVAGFLDAGAPSEVSIGDESADSFAVEWREDRLSCVAGWNAARLIMPARRELAATWADTEVAS